MHANRCRYSTMLQIYLRTVLLWVSLERDKGQKTEVAPQMWQQPRRPRCRPRESLHSLKKRLCLVDLASQVGRSAAVWVVREHQTAMRILELVRSERVAVVSGCSAGNTPDDAGTLQKWPRGLYRLSRVTWRGGGGFGDRVERPGGGGGEKRRGEDGAGGLGGSEGGREGTSQRGAALRNGRRERSDGKATGMQQCSRQRRVLEAEESEQLMAGGHSWRRRP